MIEINGRQWRIEFLEGRQICNGVEHKVVVHHLNDEPRVSFIDSLPLREMLELALEAGAGIVRHAADAKAARATLAKQQPPKRKSRRGKP